VVENLIILILALYIYFFEMRAL